MSEDLQRRAKEVLDEIADLSAPERQVALDRACGDDEALKAEVMSLLAFWSEPTVDWVGTAGSEPATEAEVAVREIGPYRTIREIGRGGMGVVYLARRKGDQFRRLVALKVLQKGMGTEEVLRRFELERQVLSALNHPGIARLYEAGETAAGTPYFVMEYVEGTDIATYCDTHRLHIAERLELFRRVCEAVHYAHQNLVIHRDLKPSNIIMTEDGQPKLLDFGIAKITNPQFSPVQGDPTAPELRVMTPEYASPEQVRGEAITTTTDVYSLGVLLYRLVCGHSPYRLKRRVREELVRVICETEPERPSTAVTTVEESVSETDGAGGTTTITPEEVGTARDARPQRLKRVLAGDIDNIVMKALRKEPQRRYTSVQQFAEDIERHLGGLPVIARPDTLSYRVSKFVRRNRWGVAATALIGAVLIGGSIAVGVAWQSERTQRRIAQDNQDLVIEMLEAFGDASRKIGKLANALPARAEIAEVVLEQIERLSAHSGSDPVIRRQLAAAHQLYGDLNDNSNPTLGDGPAALKHYNIALQIRRELFSEYPDDDAMVRNVIVSHRSVARHQRYQGEFDAAIETAEGGVAIADRWLAESPDDLDRKRVLAAILLTLGDCLVKTTKFEGAILHFERSRDLREALEIAWRKGSVEERNRSQRDLGVAYGRLGKWLAEDKRFEEARDNLEANLEFRERLLRQTSTDDARRYTRDAATARGLLGDYERRHGRPERGRTLLEQAIADTESLMAADPDDVRPPRDLARYRNRAAWACIKLEDWPAAVAHFEAQLRLSEQPKARTLAELAHAYNGAGRSDDAIRTIRAAMGSLEGRDDAASIKLREDLQETLREYGAK